MGKKSSPKAPDYAAAAEKTAAGNLETAKWQGMNNRPDLVNQYGEERWSGSVEGNNLQRDTILSENQQDIFDMLEKGQFTEAQLREMNGDKLLEAINANKDLYANAPDRGGMVDAPTYGPRVEGGQLTTDGMRGMGVNNRDMLPGMGATNRYNLPGMGQLGGLSDWGAYPTPDASQLTEGIGRKGDVAQARGQYGSGAQMANSYGQFGPTSQQAWVQDRQQSQGQEANVQGREQSTAQQSQLQDMLRSTAQQAGVQDLQQSQAQEAGVQEAMSAQGQAAYDPQFADAAFDRQMSLLQPQMDRALESQEVALRNQGLTPGTEAYDNALNDLRNQQGEQVGRAQLDAIREGRAAQGEEYARGMQNQQFNQNANDQRFNQESARFDQTSARDRFGLDAAAQRYGQESNRFDQGGAQDQFNLSAANQRYNQESNRFDQGNVQDQFNLAAGAQQFGQESNRFDQTNARDRFDLDAGAQRFGQEGATFDQANVQDQFNLTADNQRFGQESARFDQGRSLDDYNLRAGQQAYDQERTMGSDYDAARQRDFEENTGVFQGQLDQANYANELRGQQNSEQLARAGFYDNQNQQRYEQDLGYAGFDQGRRNDTVNEDLAYGSADDSRFDRDWQQRMDAANYQDSKQQYDDAFQSSRGQDAFSNQMSQQQWAQQLRDQYITEGNNQQDIAQNRGVSLANGGMINLAQPQFSGFNSYENPGGADYLGAAIAKGNFDTANKKTSIWDTASSLGAAYLGR